jgi:PIN domain nuclease of toxin-antitoxin system
MIGLVDTQILLWSFFDTSKLPAKIRQCLTDETKLIYYSPVNLWEISIKYGLGKLELNGFTPEEFFYEVENSFYRCKAVEPADAATSYQLPKLHKDPFDRLLIWEALRHNFTLLSVDDSIKQYQKIGLNLVF